MPMLNKYYFVEPCTNSHDYSLIKVMQFGKAADTEAQILSFSIRCNIRKTDNLAQKQSFSTPA